MDIVTFLKKKEYFKDMDLEYAFDSLTKVLNRETVTTYIRYLIEEKKPFSYCLADIDNFKTINDTYGHMIGDEVLKVFAQSLVKCIGNTCVIGRYGGDEFIIVAEGITEYNDVWNVCHTINKDVAKIAFEQYPMISLTVTTGVARFPLDASNFDDLMKIADKALYRGKTKGRNCFIIYLPEKHANIEAIENKEAAYNSMDLHYKIFTILTRGNDIKENIKHLIQYLSATLMLDHTCIQKDGKMMYSVVHPLSKIKRFDAIDDKLIDDVSNGIGLFYVNHRKTLLQVNKNDLHEAMKKQGVSSMLTCSIEAYGKKYGILRADGATTHRIWQSSEMDLVVTAAKLLAVLLYHNNL